MVTIDLNADVGEECGDDAALFALVTSANVAAGGHAGGGEVLAATVALAVRHGVAVGAHPSYPDRPAFGRISRMDDHGHDGIRRFVADQVRAVARECKRHGVPLTHVKAHGALYADAAADPLVAEAFLAGVADAMTRTLEAASGPGTGEETQVAIVGPAGSRLAEVSVRRGHAFIAEVFADRAYTREGTLVPRSEPGAVIHDAQAVARRAARMVLEGRVEAIDGTVLEIVGATVCLHGDTPGAVEIAKQVREELTANGVVVRCPTTIGAPPQEAAFRVSWFGDSAVVVDVVDLAVRMGLAAHLADALPGREVRLGMASVLVGGDTPDAALLERVRELVATGPAGDRDAPGVRRLVTLRVAYDGADLADAARMLDCSAAQLTSAHQRQHWQVAMMGFAPGFGYLQPEGDLELPWDELPRRASPRTRVPAGSVAVAAGMSAVYPAAMPGGWQLIGTCPEPLFDPEAVGSPSRLRAGDIVRFERADG
ncbi:MAG: 5-oxoprolinase subunit PxpA [Actinomycetales bacterium]|nr:5-oxoprolinase subunit PxpA [Actinomycetales bacterium]